MATYTPATDISGKQLTGADLDKVFNQNWNSAWQEGYNSAQQLSPKGVQPIWTGGSYPGAQVGFNAGIAEFYKRNPSSGKIAGASNASAPSAPTPNVSTPSGGSGNGFSMSYYPGWGEAEARADWAATGGSKANQNTGGGVPGVDTSSMQDIYNQQNQLIDTTAGQNAGLLDAQEAARREAYTGQTGTTESTYTNRENTLKGQFELGEKGYENQGYNLENKKTDALNAAKRLFEAYSMGARQRFGGASSAAEASQSILATEMQRTSGNIARDYISNTQTLFLAKADFDKSYQSNLAQLATEKSAAITDLRNQFNSDILNIYQQKNQNSQWASEKKLEALTSLSNSIASVQAKALEYKQQLAMQQTKAETDFQYSLALLKAKAEIAQKPDAIDWKISKDAVGNPFFYNSKGDIQEVDLPSTQPEEPQGIWNTIKSKVTDWLNPDEETTNSNLVWDSDWNDYVDKTTGLPVNNY